MGGASADSVIPGSCDVRERFQTPTFPFSTGPHWPTFSPSTRYMVRHFHVDSVSV